MIQMPPPLGRYPGGCCICLSSTHNCGLLQNNFDILFRLIFTFLTHPSPKNISVPCTIKYLPRRTRTAFATYFFSVCKKGGARFISKCTLEYIHNPLSVTLIQHTLFIKQFLCFRRFFYQLSGDIIRSILDLPPSIFCLSS